MKRRSTKRKRQGCEIAKAIDIIDKAASTAMKIYRTIEPIAKAILKNGGKTK